MVQCDSGLTVPTANTNLLFVDTPASPTSLQGPLGIPIHSVHLVTLLPSMGQPQSTSQLTLSHGVGPGRSLEKSAEQRTVSDSTPPSLVFFARRSLHECLDLAFVAGAQLQSTAPPPPASDMSWVVSGWVPGGASVYNWQPWKDPSPWDGL